MPAVLGVPLRVTVSHPQKLGRGAAAAVGPDTTVMFNEAPAKQPLPSDTKTTTLYGPPTGSPLNRVESQISQEKVPTEVVHWYVRGGALLVATATKLAS